MPNESLVISPHGLEFISRFEGWSPDVYTDQAGLPTIGFGHLITQGEVGYVPADGASYADGLKGWVEAAKAHYPKALTDEEGMDLLRADVGLAEDVVRRRVRVELIQNQFDALVSFTFNVGARGFVTSSLLTRINRKASREDIRRAFMMWIKVRDPKTGQRVQSQGLVRRRMKEADLFTGMAV